MHCKIETVVSTSLRILSRDIYILSAECIPLQAPGIPIVLLRPPCAVLLVNSAIPTSTVQLYCIQGNQLKRSVETFSGTQKKREMLGYPFGHGYVVMALKRVPSHGKAARQRHRDAI